MMPGVGTLCPLIQVYDMPRALAFYRDKLGFQLDSDSGGGDDADWCLLKLGGSSLMLNTDYEAAERPPAPDQARIAAHQDTGLFFNCQSADAIYDYLKARGVALDPPKTAPYGMRQLYLRDPDGYELCFQHPA
ncbi:MAG: VOC family protein [Hyphomonadaceae bacterium]|nr:VOC family protein [Hyphomonadaceae bacterium]